MPEAETNWPLHGRGSDERSCGTRKMHYRSDNVGLASSRRSRFISRMQYQDAEGWSTLSDSQGSLRGRQWPGAKEALHSELAKSGRQCGLAGVI
eukprot:1139961-Pelagomonas_calceolata.AAC.3